MKKFFIVSIIMAMFFSSVEAAFTELSAPQTVQAVGMSAAKETLEKFTTMSRKEYETLTGKHLNLFERLAFKIAQHKLKRELRKMQEPSTNTVLLVILALLLPPLAVYLHQGEVNHHFWLNLVLTLLFFLPGVIHALIVILGNKN